MTLNGVMAITLRYFSEFGKPVLLKTICGGIYARDCILLRVQYRRKESSRSLSHLLMSFLFSLGGPTKKRTLQKATERLYFTYLQGIPHSTKFN